MLNWLDIDTVLLDMDGTLLDLHFDDHFWRIVVPEAYSKKNQVSMIQAQEKLFAMFRSLEGTLVWTNLDFWSTELGLDIPELKLSIDHLIQSRPYVLEFLHFCQDNKKNVIMVTNAHYKSLDLKMSKIDLRSWFDKIICSADFGCPKEDPVFWKYLSKKIDFNPARTLLADDTEGVLVSAKEYGIKHLIYMAKPSSKVPARFSEKFKSVRYFKELI
jgi:5'-nucleotidase